MEVEDIYLTKAEESLAGAVSEFANSRYNNCANRCYYGCFQAAVSALRSAGLSRPGGWTTWSHEQIQALFARESINRRKVYMSELRDVLPRLYLLREAADYKQDLVSEIQAARLAACARFSTGDPGARRAGLMNETYIASLDPRRLAAVRELSALITQRYAGATFFVDTAEADPAITHLTALIDVDDPDEVADLVMERMLQLQLEENIPICVIPIRTPERLAALREQQRGRASLASILPLWPGFGRTASAPG